MPNERRIQTCGNCGQKNDAAAIVCASCGVVMAAYAVPTEPGVAVPPVQEIEPPVSTPTTPELEASPPPAQTADWRELFARPVPAEPEPEPEPLPPPPKPRPARNRPAPVPPAPVAAVGEDPELPASVAAMRKRANRLPATPAPRIPEENNTPSATKPAPMATAAVARLPKLVLAGVAVMLVSCLLFGITVTFSSAEGAPGFAIFCLFPIGVIMLVMGLSGRLAKRRKDDQRG